MKMTRKTNEMLIFLIIVLFNQMKMIDLVNPCIYNLNPKGIIDLTSLGKTDGTPKWKNILPQISDLHEYSYNPCQSFTQGNCLNVASCQTYIQNVNLTYSLGTQNSIQWKVRTNEEYPILVYSSSERTLNVNLRCLKEGEDDRLDVYGYNPSTRLFTMTLSSQCVCWNICRNGPPPPKPKRKSPLSGGGIFLLFIGISFLLYFLSFLLLNKFKRKATGIELIPHRTFWILFFSYSFDGISFLFTKLTNKSRTYNSL